MIAVKLLALALAQAPAAASPAPAATPKPAPAGPFVVLETTLGTIKLALNKEKAPLSVDNFLKYVRARHYDGTIFHRVIPGFMIQGGGMDAQMVEKKTLAAIRNEAKNGLSNRRGALAMARTNDPNSATAQFFINLKDNLRLDFGVSGAGYAVFGEVTEGMDVVDKIAAVDTTSKGGHENVPMVSVVIKSAREVGAAPAPKPTAKP
jgi:cyclophilin family peptidyl-prolyl cis-trans isomerase